MTENNSSSLSMTNIESFISNQAKLNTVMSDFMATTTQSLASAEAKSFALLEEIKKLREPQPPKKKQRVEKEADISLTLNPEEEEELLQDDDEMSVHSGHDTDPEDQAWADRSGDRSADTADEVEIDEGILRSKYKGLYTQVEEVGGAPVSRDLAKVVKETWGKTILSSKKKKELLDDTLIPSNTQQLNPPQLNAAILIRLNVNQRSKDNAAKDRQLATARATVPLLYSLGELDHTREILKKNRKIAKEVDKVNSLEEAKNLIKHMSLNQNKMMKSFDVVNGHIEHAVKVNNYSYTATTRKRKQDVCSGLGSTFGVYAQDIEVGKEHIFTVDTMKAMKSELKHIKPKEDYSKNGGHFKKARWSGSNQGSQNFQSQKKFSSNFKRPLNNNVQQRNQKPYYKPKKN